MRPKIITEDFVYTVKYVEEQPDFRCLRLTDRKEKRKLLQLVRDGNLEKCPKDWKPIPFIEDKNEDLMKDVNKVVEVGLEDTHTIIMETEKEKKAEKLDHKKKKVTICTDRNTSSDSVNTENNSTEDEPVETDCYQNRAGVCNVIKIPWESTASAVSQKYDRQQNNQHSDDMHIVKKIPEQRQVETTEEISDLHSEVLPISKPLKLQERNMTKHLKPEAIPFKPCYWCEREKLHKLYKQSSCQIKTNFVPEQELRNVKGKKDRENKQTKNRLELPTQQYFVNMYLNKDLDKVVEKCHAKDLPHLATENRTSKKFELDDAPASHNDVNLNKTSDEDVTLCKKSSEKELSLNNILINAEIEKMCNQVTEDENGDVSDIKQKGRFKFCLSDIRAMREKTLQNKNQSQAAVQKLVRAVQYDLKKLHNNEQ